MKTTKTVWMLGHKITLITCGERYLVLDITTPPGVPGPPPHHHEDSDEMFHVLEGRLEVFCHGSWQSLGPGQTATAQRGDIHTFRNPTDGAVRWLTAWNPPGFQEWFGEYGIDASEPEAQERSVSEEAIATAVDASMRFGLVLAEGP